MLPVALCPIFIGGVLFWVSLMNDAGWDAAGLVLSSPLWEELSDASGDDEGCADATECGSSSCPACQARAQGVATDDDPQIRQLKESARLNGDDDDEAMETTTSPRVRRRLSNAKESASIFSMGGYSSSMLDEVLGVAVF